MNDEQAWVQEDIAALWGWLDAGPRHEVVPIEDRCWRCDGRRIHEGCAAGLCDPCCRELKSATAA